MAQLNKLSAYRVVAMACVASLILSAVAAAAVDFEQVRRLRRQGLFRAAERKCMELLETELSTADRSLVAVEYFRTVEVHISTVDAQQRRAIIEQAENIHDHYVRKTADSPYSFLVEIQFAIVRSANAALARFDAEANLTTDGYDTAVKLCKNVIHDLETLEQRIGESMRSAIRKRTASVFSQTQYQRLIHTVNWETARGWVNLAKCFPDSKKDQISLFAKAADITSTLSRLTSNPSISTKARLLDAECQRRVGNASRSRQLLAELASEKTSDSCIRLAAATQQIELYLELGDFSAAQNAVSQARSLNCANRQARAEHAFATLRLYVELAVQSKKSDSSWHLRSQQQAKNIEREFPGYWKRRSDVVLARLRGGASIAAELAQLETKAARQFTEKQFEAAVETYRQAEKAAAEEKLDDRVFEYRHRAGAILHQQQRYAEATKILRQAAIAGKDQPDANTAHLSAIVGAAQLARSGTKHEVEQYAEMLSEHLALWPDRSDTKNQVAWWLGQLRQRQQQPAESISALDKIEHDFENYRRVIDAMHDAYASQVTAAGDAKQRSELIAQASAHLESIASEMPEGSSLQRWGNLSAIDLQLIDSSKTASSERKLLKARKSAIENRDSETATKAAQLLVVCYVTQSRPSQARKFVHALENLELEQLYNLMRRIDQILATDARRTDSSRLQLDLLELQVTDDNLPDDIQIIRVRSLRRTKQYAEAIQILRQLTENQPENSNLRIELATVLELAKKPTDALNEWRKLAAGSIPASNPWFAAKYGIAKNLLAVQKADEAADVIRITQALHPEMGDPQSKRLFESLLRRCEDNRREK